MRVAKTSEIEISQLAKVLNEIERFSKDIRHSYLDEFDFSDYEVLSGFDRNSEKGFLSDLCEYLASIHFQRILLNCSTMLENCADPDLDHLEFHPDIRKGLILLNELESQTEPKGS